MFSSYLNDFLVATKRVKRACSEACTAESEAQRAETQMNESSEWEQGAKRRGVKRVVANVSIYRKGA